TIRNGDFLDGGCWREDNKRSCHDAWTYLPTSGRDLSYRSLTEPLRASSECCQASGEQGDVLVRGVFVSSSQRRSSSLARQARLYKKCRPKAKTRCITTLVAS